MDEARAKQIEVRDALDNNLLRRKAELEAQLSSLDTVKSR